jgi:hypothetical protein
VSIEEHPTRTSFLVSLPARSTAEPDLTPILPGSV